MVGDNVNPVLEDFDTEHLEGAGPMPHPQSTSMMTIDSISETCPCT